MFGELRGLRDRIKAWRGNALEATVVRTRKEGIDEIDLIYKEERVSGIIRGFSKEVLNPILSWFIDNNEKSGGLFRECVLWRLEPRRS